MSFINMKRTRKDVPYKKWTDQEVSNLLEYIETADGFELPTAQAFYKQLLLKTGINATWSLVRWKVRNLRISYKKVKEWHESAAAALMESDEGAYAVQKRIQRMCPYYERLHNIFSDRPEFCNSKPVVDPATLQCLLDDSLFSLDDESISAFTEYSSEMGAEAEPETYNATSPKQQAFDSTENGINDAEASHFPASVPMQQIQIKNERLSWLEMKLDLEKQKIVKEFEIKEQRLNLDREIFHETEKRLQQELELKREELNLKKMQMEKEERMQIMEMEKSERIARYELELKYGKSKN